MATETIPAPTLAAIQQVLDTYETSNAQTQQDIQNVLWHGLGLSGILQPAGEVSSSLSITPVTGTRIAYDKDFHAWCETQAALLQERQWQALDREHLIEELRLMAGNERRALGSRLQGLLLHLLKWQFQPDKRRTGHSWEDSIVEARERLHDMLDDGGSLRHFVEPLLGRHYPRARRTAVRQTGLPRDTFPATCPWTPEQVLDPDFWPGEDGATAGLP